MIKTKLLLIMGLLLTLIIAGIGGYFVAQSIKKGVLAPKSQPKVSYDNSFSQNGVTVDFQDGTIKIFNYSYPVNAVTGLGRETNDARGEKFLQSGTVKISVDDFEKPVHRITFRGLNSFSNSEEFIQRLSIALRKAGGPSFS